jgi:hypothetical protein
MRDIVRDAAIITVARKVMEDDWNVGWMNVYSFLETYADSPEDEKELRETLEFFDLIREKYVKNRWDSEGTRILYWSNADN